MWKKDGQEGRERNKMVNVWELAVPDQTPALRGGRRCCRSANEGS